MSTHGGGQTRARTTTKRATTKRATTQAERATTKRATTQAERNLARYRRLLAAAQSRVATFRRASTGRASYTERMARQDAHERVARYKGAIERLRTTIAQEAEASRAARDAVKSAPAQQSPTLRAATLRVHERARSEIATLETRLRADPEAHARATVDATRALDQRLGTLYARLTRERDTAARGLTAEATNAQWRARTRAVARADAEMAATRAVRQSAGRLREIAQYVLERPAREAFVAEQARLASQRVRTFADAFEARAPGTYESRRVFASQDAAIKAMRAYARKFDLPARQLTTYRDGNGYGWRVFHSTNPGDIA